MSLSVEIRLVGLKAFVRKMKGFENLTSDDEFVGVLQSSGFLMERKARENVPVRSRLMKSKITSEVRGIGTKEITLRLGLSQRLKYGPSIELGSVPHIIRARLKKSLHFFKDGAEYFRKEVFHPGTQAQPFLRPAVKDVQPRLLQRLQLLIKKKLERRESDA